MQEKETEVIKKIRKGKFSKWIWLTFLLGGLFMVYGGILNIMIYFNMTLPLAPPKWNNINIKFNLISGILILILALFLIQKSFEFRLIIERKTKKAIKPFLNLLFIICAIGTIIDFVAGYYARGFLIGILGLIYVNYSLEKKARFLFFSLIIILLIIAGFIYSGI